MQLTPLDWLVVLAGVAISFVPALLLARRAGRSTAEFFTSGRAAPWWLVGTSMVATTFSTDTPNLVTDFVRTSGVSKNWSWWAFLLTGMLTVFFYARLWRRSGVLTDLEFYELRYSGKPAAILRGFRAIYLGLLFNGLIMATVTLAAVKIANVLLGWDRWQTVLVCTLLCVAFSAISGLWGVLAADLIQFVIAMVGVIAAAGYALDHPAVGGLRGLVAKVDPATLSLLPDLSDPSLLVSVLVIPLAVQWWAVWYPGAEPGGGSYIAQRMLAARDERHAMTATLWFNVAHYALRPWPWIIVALCSLLVYPTLDELHAAFPHIDPKLLGDDIAYPAMLTLLPHGLLGLLVASLTCAYISTMSTHLNWGASYLVHDFYRRFVRPNTDERHYVAVSRLVTVGLMIVSGLTVYALDTAGTAFQVLLSVGAGTGLIYLLRWFWWRINAWTEIAGMVASFAISVGLMLARQAGLKLSDDAALLITVFGTTACWLAVTLLTPPAARATLVRFYERVRPAGPGWRMIRERAGLPPSPDSPATALLGFFSGCVLVYAALFGTGLLLYGRIMPAAACGLLALAGGLGVATVLRRQWQRS